MSGAYTITVGIQITRRKFVHIITDPEGRDIFVSRSFEQCLDYLAENDVHGAQIVTESWRWDIELAGRHS